MFSTLRNAFKVKDIRKRLIYTFIALLVVRLGTLLPTPGINSTLLSENWFQSDAFSFVNSITGGSFRRMSIFALSITPYISASIIMQLLTIAIPKLEELHKEGEDGRKKMNEITRYLSVGLSVIEAVAMAIGFGSQGYLNSYNFTNVTLVVAAFVAGSTFLMWVGERITENGVGNGISIILTINIISRMPSDFITLFQTYVISKPVVNAIVAVLVIVGVTVGSIVYVVVLQGAVRKIPVTYAKKVVGRKAVGGQTSNIPLKVNTAGVIPVIFSSSIMSFPGIIAGFFDVEPARAYFWPKVLLVLHQQAWFNFKSFGDFKYTIGFIFYIVLTIFFAYFYTSITFNPIEVSNNIKKQGGFIPGIRPGKPTTEYLTKVLNYIIFIGAIGLSIAVTIPIVFLGAFNAEFTATGTSIIIIVGVIVETIKQIESQLLVRHYKGFLND